jgi:hypothetical protein
MRDIIGDGEDVDFERTGCERRKFVLGIGAEDRLITSGWPVI